MRSHSSFFSACLGGSASLSLVVIAVACSPASTKSKTDADVEKASAPAPTLASASGTPEAHAPIQAHGGGMPPGHPLVGSGPMMGSGSQAAVLAGPVNPHEVTPSGELRVETFDLLSADVPTEWTRRPPKSSMRLAELVLPGPGGDAVLAIYRFAGGAGGVEANIRRWKGQFTPPEGKTIDDMSTVVTEERAPFKITRLDVRGTNSAAVMPGEAARHSAPDSRMLAAIVEGSGDPFFFKVVGTAATLDLWAPAFEKMLGGVRMDTKVAE